MISHYYECKEPSFPALTEERAGVRETIGPFFGDVECDVISPLAYTSLALGGTITNVGSQISSFTFIIDFGEVTLKLCPPFLETAALNCLELYILPFLFLFLTSLGLYT